MLIISTTARSYAELTKCIGIETCNMEIILSRYYINKLILFINIILNKKRIFLNVKNVSLKACLE